MEPLTPLFVHSITAVIQTGVKASHLFKIWGIYIETSRRNIEVTTQLRQQDTGSLSRNFSTNGRMLRYKRINCAFFTDTYFVTSKAKSTQGNNMMQLFVSEKGFVYIVPIKSRGDFQLALKIFSKEIGVPLSLILYPSGDQTSAKVTKVARYGHHSEDPWIIYPAFQPCWKIFWPRQDLNPKGSARIRCTYGLVGFICWAPDANQQFDWLSPPHQRQQGEYFGLGSGTGAGQSNCWCAFGTQHINPTRP